jgi:hypothetical protein
MLTELQSLSFGIALNILSNVNDKRRTNAASTNAYFTTLRTKIRCFGLEMALLIKWSQ